MKAAGLGLQILAAAGLIMGVMFGTIELSTFSTRDAGIPTIVASVAGGILVFVLGAILVALGNIDTNVRRAANALDRIAKAQLNKP